MKIFWLKDKPPFLFNGRCIQGHFKNTHPPNFCVSPSSGILSLGVGQFCFETLFLRHQARPEQTRKCAACLRMPHPGMIHSGAKGLPAKPEECPWQMHGTRVLLVKPHSAFLIISLPQSSLRIFLLTLGDVIFPFPCLWLPTPPLPCSSETLNLATLL